MSQVVCRQCVLSKADEPSLTFDEHGICSICKLYEQRKDSKMIFRREGKAGLLKLIERIKKEGRGAQYDCIIGLSGGTDSSYVAWLAKEYGLRPLAVHLDNGWNSELAIINIQRILDKLQLDLYTYVINWDEFKDLQRAYIRASVIDIEALTDHAISATLYQVARKFGIKFILSGESFETEGILPPSWVHIKLDHVNIKGIHNKFGQRPLKTFPFLNYFKYLYISKITPVSFVPILNFLPYNKVEAKKILVDELGWRDYGGKHHESIFTRFYQMYILPQKFGVDKRKSHYSTLICAGQMSRDEALAELQKPIGDPQKIGEDKSYVVKKLGFSEDEFDFFMNQKPVSHLHYPSVVHQINFMKKILLRG